MRRRRGPARGRDRPPLRALALGQIDQPRTRRTRRRDAIRLHAEPRVVLVRPLHQRPQELGLEQLGEQLAPVVAHPATPGVVAGHQQGQVVAQVVAVEATERREQVGRPVASVDLETVAEDRVRLRRGERRQHGRADGAQVAGERLTIVVVQDEAFAANGGTLHLHAGATFDEDPGEMVGHQGRRQRHAPVTRSRQVQGRERGRVGRRLGALRQKGGEVRFAALEVWQTHGSRAGGLEQPDHAQRARRIGGRNRWATEGPAAAEREVEAESQARRGGASVLQSVEEAGRQERLREVPGRGVIQGQRIDGLHLDAPEAGVLHGLQIAIESGRRHRGTEPPPAHHHPRVVWRSVEHLSQRCGGWGRRRRRLRLRPHQCERDTDKHHHHRRQTSNDHAPPVEAPSYTTTVPAGTAAPSTPS